MAEDPVRGSAFHEAAHAVVARYYGCSIGRVWISLDPSDPVGAADIASSTLAPEAKYIIARAPVACVAGCGVPPAHDLHALGDEGQMLTILSELYPDDDDRAEVIGDLLCEIADELYQRADIQAATKALADELCGKGEVSGSEAMEIIDRFLG